MDDTFAGLDVRGKIFADLLTSRRRREVGHLSIFDLVVCLIFVRCGRGYIVKMFKREAIMGDFKYSLQSYEPKLNNGLFVTHSITRQTEFRISPNVWDQRKGVLQCYSQ